MKITIKQVIDFVDAMSKMKDGGVYLKGLKNIDLAMNKSKLQPIYDGYVTASETPIKYQKYIREIEDLKLKFSGKNGELTDPQKIYEEFNTLKNKYESAINEYEEWKIAIKEMLNEEKEVDLIMIDKSEFNFSDDKCTTAPEILFGLLPCIKQ